MRPRPKKAVWLLAIMLIAIGLFSTLLLKDFEIAFTLKYMKSPIKPAGPKVLTPKPTLPLVDFEIASETLESIKPLIEPAGPKVKSPEPIPLRVFTTSAPSEFAQRMAIRATWKSGLESSIPDSSLTFVLGRADSEPENAAVAAEARKYGDILQGSFMDSYMNLTLKTYFFIKWAAAQREASFILKTDTDSFVLPRSLAAFLRSLSKEDRFRPQFWCYVHHEPKVYRNPSSKWHVSYRAYPRPTYPTHCSGTAYLMTGITAVLLNISVRVDHFQVPWEDVVFTGIVPEELGIPRKSNSGFQPPYNPPLKDPCQTKGILAMHRVKTPVIMQSLWNNLSKCSTAQLK